MDLIVMVAPAFHAWKVNRALSTLGDAVLTARGGCGHRKSNPVCLEAGNRRYRYATTVLTLFLHKLGRTRSHTIFSKARLNSSSNEKISTCSK